MSKRCFFMAEKMVDAIRDGQIVTVTEAQARAEDLFVLREKHAPAAATPPLTGQPALRAATKANMPTIAPKLLPRHHSYLPDYKKNDVAKELVNNFHWEIGKARKERNMTRLQLANALSVSENVVKMLENGELPTDDFVLINKVQSYLRINLRKDGKSFDAPLRSQLSSTPQPAPVVAQPTASSVKRPIDSNVSLAYLQRMKSRDAPVQKEMSKPRWIKDKPVEEKKGSLLGDDIEIIE
jgi:ribosome-binding protein aMBF1 (putative translation factor)